MTLQFVLPYYGSIILLIVVIGSAAIWWKWKAELRNRVLQGLDSADLDTARRNYRRWELGAGSACLIWAAIRTTVLLVHVLLFGTGEIAKNLGPSGAEIFEVNPSVRTVGLLIGIEFAVSFLIGVCGLLAILQRRAALVFMTFANLFLVIYNLTFLVLSSMSRVPINQQGTVVAILLITNAIPIFVSAICIKALIARAGVVVRTEIQSQRNAIDKPIDSEGSSVLSKFGSTLKRLATKELWPRR
jgi:hypothetical protein